MTHLLTVVFVVINAIISLTGLFIAALAIVTITKTKEIQRWDTTFALSSLAGFASIVLVGTGIVGSYVAYHAKPKALKFYLMWLLCFTTLVTVALTLLFFLTSIGIGLLTYDKGKDATRVFENYVRALSVAGFSTVLCEILTLFCGGWLLMRVKKLDHKEEIPILWHSNELTNENRMIEQTPPQIPNFVDPDEEEEHAEEMHNLEIEEQVVPPPIKPDPFRSPSESLRSEDLPHETQRQPRRAPIIPISSVTRIKTPPKSIPKRQPQRLHNYNKPQLEKFDRKKDAIEKSTDSTKSAEKSPPGTPPNISTQAQPRSKNKRKSEDKTGKFILRLTRPKQGKSFSKSLKTASSRSKSSKRGKVTK